MTEQIEFVDRYSALGIKPPPMFIVCRGQCEGTGVYPEQFQETGDFDADWRFVTCEDCGGTGRRRGNVAVIFIRGLPRALAGKARFARQFLFSRYSWRMDVPHPWRFNLRIVLRVLLKSW